MIAPDTAHAPSPDARDARPANVTGHHGETAILHRSRHCAGHTPPPRSCMSIRLRRVAAWSPAVVHDAEIGAIRAVPSAPCAPHARHGTGIRYTVVWRATSWHPPGLSR